MNHFRLNLAFIGALVVLTSLGVGVVWSGRPEVPAFKPPRAVTTARLAIHFEPREAQTGEPAHFTARGAGYSVSLGPTRMNVNLAGPNRGSGETVEMEIVGGDQHAKAEGLDRLPGNSNYFIGNNPSLWRRKVPHFARVRYDDVYPGIDLVYYGASEEGGSVNGHLEYDFVVEPGADPAVIQLAFHGAQEVSLDGGGDLLLETGAGEIRQHRPVVYQELAETRKRVGGRYRLAREGRVRFEIGTYDRSLPLVIDPMFEFSTYLGGDGDDQAFGIAVGPDGSVYVVGWTESADFPAGSPPALTGSGNSPQQGRPGTGRDAFLTRFDNSLSERLVQNFFGGNNTDQAFDVVVDRDGNPYIIGFTDSSDFPTTDDSQPSGGRDSFIATFDANGRLLYSGLLGGNGDDEGFAIDSLVIGDSVLVVSGGGTEGNFPVTPDAFQPNYGGGTRDGYVDALRLDTTVGPTFAVAERATSYLGGNRFDIVDSFTFANFRINFGFRFDQNDPVVGMTTSSDGLFVSPDAPQPNRAGGTDGYVSVLRLDPTFAPAWPTGDDVAAFATYLPGGSKDESEVSFEISEGGLGGPRFKDKMFFFYNTRSDDVPTQEGVFMEDNPGGTQSVVMSGLVFNEQTGTAEFRTTYVGGNELDQVAGMTLDSSGRPYVVGLTFSRNLPTTLDAPFPNPSGQAFNGFLIVLDEELLGIDFGTYLWGGPNSVATDVAVDLGPFGSIYVTGINQRGAFTTPGASQPGYGGGPWDATGGAISPVQPTLRGQLNGVNFINVHTALQITDRIRGQVE